jgi:hypothetical protein
VDDTFADSKNKQKKTKPRPETVGRKLRSTVGGMVKVEI